MHTLKIIIPKPGDRVVKEKQLAWQLALMASQEWNSNQSINEMVGNRLIDNAGVAIAAINRDPVCVARAQAMFHKNKNGAPIFGLSNEEKYNCEWAAWANAVAVRELDFHDNIMAKETCHPGDCIPTILAVAQQKNLTGIDLIKGIATSYETQLRLSMSIALNPNKIDHVGHLGPAITSGIGAMLNLDTEIIYQAIQYSAHTSIFTRQGRKGDLSSWKAFAPGLVGRNAIDAIDRAVRGEKGPSPVWEGDYGIIPILLHKENENIEISLPGANAPRDGILSTFTKEHSAGYHGNSIIDLAFLMRKKIKDLKEIKKVNIYSKKYTHIVMGSGSNDPEKYSPEASRETLDHSAMYIFAVALEDGFWHHETSYSNERKTRAETLRLWRKIETFEDPEFNKKYYDEKDPLKKVQGAKVEITLNDGSIIVETLDFANAHPGGTTPFRRNEYINKMKPLINGFVSQGEELRFVELINNLENLNSDEIKTLNLVCDEGTVDLNKNKINGIFN
jgi:2-methylcitrate dehydratase|tara:strand:+ start:3442 stop:4956 length:1515 start_codon:yes stop_codon:yes gene_type:complete